MYYPRPEYIRPSEYRSPLRHSSPDRAHEFVATLSPSRRYTYIAPSVREYQRYVPTYAPAAHSPVKHLYARHHHSPVRTSAHVPIHYSSPVRVAVHEPRLSRTPYYSSYSAARPMMSGYEQVTPKREPEQ